MEAIARPVEAKVEPPALPLPAVKPLDDAAWQKWLAKGRSRDDPESAAWTNILITAATVALVTAAALLLLGASPPDSLAADLSKYRDFQLGADLETVAKQIDADSSQVKRIHNRPAIVQQLSWRPRRVGTAAQPDTVREVVLSFLDGKLYRVAVEYDRYEISGMTEDDVISAISSVYGKASRPASASSTAYGPYGSPQQMLANWENERHRFSLFHSSYGPSFKLIGVEKALETKAIAAIAQAERLDDNEAPERDAARILGEEEAAKAKLDKARDLNKPKFRP